MNRRGIDELPIGKSVHERADFWIERREFLDSVLEKPAQSLVRLVRRSLDSGTKGGSAPDGFAAPVAIYGGGEEPAPRRSLLVHGVACLAVQHLDVYRRRYSWLSEVDQELKGLCEMIPNAFLKHPAFEQTDPLDRLKVLGDPVFGDLNALTAAEVFWVLLRAGEQYAHSRLGFLALFSLLWALNRRTDGSFNAGAALGHWRPSVAVTARCLLPIQRLTLIIDKRANLYREAVRLCETLHRNEHASTEYERWTFASGLERLSALLLELASVSIVREDVKVAAKAVTRLANPIVPQTPTGPIAEEVRMELRALFVKLGTQNESILAGAEESTGLQGELIDILSRADDRAKLLGVKCKLRRAKQDPWGEQLRSARLASKTCVDTLNELQRAVVKARALPSGNAFTHEVLVATLNDFAEMNESIRDSLTEAIKDNTDWCRSAVTREVAYASAGNDSEFDAAELLSGLVIARDREVISRAEVDDALRHSLRAARPDGSWASDQPVYIENHFVGVWPGTADLLVLLSKAVRSGHGLVYGSDVADRHLLRYVALLEGRRKKVRKWSYDKREFWGFPPESRQEFIDVWETAMSVRALVGIRVVIEDRLWEICNDRFTIKQPHIGLADLDPVDLGARHDKRLQTRLLRNAASARHEDDNAEYAYVLHGPPGSSKTVIAEAIGREMWAGRDPRFVRITPADFTRSGEDGVDVEARFIFRLLSHVRRVTIFFDEIDDLLRQRKIDADLSFIRLVIPGMLNRLQDLRDAAPRQEICFLLATNYVDQIEPALTRRGRIDAPIPVPYPDPWSRQSILERLIDSRKKKGKMGADLPSSVKNAVINKTADWPWSTYQKLCREIIADGCQTVEEVEIKVEGFSAEFESADYYYWRVDRWKNTSPLVNEFVHFAFGASKLKHECRKRVTDLEAYLRPDSDVPVDRLKLAERFDKAWEDTARG